MEAQKSAWYIRLLGGVSAGGAISSLFLMILMWVFSAPALVISLAFGTDLRLGGRAEYLSVQMLVMFFFQLLLLLTMTSLCVWWLKRSSRVIRGLPWSVSVDGVQRVLFPLKRTAQCLAAYVLIAVAGVGLLFFW